MALPALQRDIQQVRPVRRFEPFQELEDLQHQMGQLIESVLTPARGGNGGSLWSPLVDVEETEDAWIVEAELPGVDRKDVSVELRDSELSITGEGSEHRPARVCTHAAPRRTAVSWGGRPFGGGNDAPHFRRSGATGRAAGRGAARKAASVSGGGRGAGGRGWPGARARGRRRERWQARKATRALRLEGAGADAPGVRGPGDGRRDRHHEPAVGRQLQLLDTRHDLVAQLGIEVDAVGFKQLSRRLVVAFRFDALDGLLSRVPIDVDDSHLRAFFREQLRRGAAHSGARCRHDPDLVLPPHGLSPPRAGLLPAIRSLQNTGSVDNLPA